MLKIDYHSQSVRTHMHTHTHTQNPHAVIMSIGEHKDRFSLCDDTNKPCEPSNIHSYTHKRQLMQGPQGLLVPARRKKPSLCSPMFIMPVWELGVGADWLVSQASALGSYHPLSVVCSWIYYIFYNKDTLCMVFPLKCRHSHLKYDIATSCADCLACLFYLGHGSIIFYVNYVFVTSARSNTFRRRHSN